MKTNNIILFLGIITLLSCSEHKQDKGTIKGDISKLTTDFDQVVILRMGNPDLGDSTDISDTIDAKAGRFEYQYKHIVPKFTAFHLLKNGKKIGNLGFRDKYTYQDSFLGNVFLGDEPIIIYVDTLYPLKKYNGITNYNADIKGSIEAEIFMKSMRKVLISTANIKKYNDSYAMLYHLYYLKDDISVKQLEDYSKLFSDNIKKSVAFGLLQKYIENRVKLNAKGYKDGFNWKDINQNTYNFEQALNGKEYVLLIFWASWCKPCRAEIPELKEFYKKNKDKISMVSLSIDDDYNRWKEALEKEQMPWLNLSGLPKFEKKIKLEYNISFVPYMILLDKNGNSFTKPGSDLHDIIEILNP